MREEFLHYVWQHRHFDFLNAKTTEGLALSVVFPGYHNHDAGPDFLQAVVTIGDMRWVGSVEIHCRSSDWFRHQHQYDDKYRSVVLHVVYEHDRDIELSDEERIPTLELKGLIPPEIFERYETLMNEPDMLLCRNHLQNVESIIIQNKLSESLIERMLRRQSGFQQTLDSCQKDWNELIYRIVAIGFGCKKNGTAFELLAQSLPYKILKAHLNSRLQIYALVFGQSGLLENADCEEYTDRLRYEYDYLRYKYRLIPLGLHQWNWLRLRPQNFPTLRLAQFAQMLYETGNCLAEKVLKANMQGLRTWLTLAPDDYWQTHYLFGKPTAQHPSGMGTSIVNSLIINTVIPIRFFYARFNGDEQAQEDSLSLLEQIGYEDNKTTRIFAETRFPCRSAYDSQAQLELFGQYCARKLCLRCSIGEKIIKKAPLPTPYHD